MMEDAGAGCGPAADLSLKVEAETIARFGAILQEGFFIRAQEGTSVAELLVERLGLSDGYVAERISTVFLDGKPVDDLESATIGEGSTLALSSAMPGLVGATMRRQGFYASFRSAITYHGERPGRPGKVVLLRVKVFNLLLSDIGRLFLEKGIYVPSAELEAFLAKSERLFEGITEAALDGLPVPPLSLRRAGAMGGCAFARLKVCASP